MSIRWIACFVIAALLLAGAVGFAVREIDRSGVAAVPAGTDFAEWTAEEAVAAALAHAGVSADRVTRVVSRYEMDDGRPEWSVSFRRGLWEYDYEIHAVTGRVLEWDRDIDI